MHRFPWCIFYNLSLCQCMYIALFEFFYSATRSKLMKDIFKKTNFVSRPEILNKMLRFFWSTSRGKPEIFKIVACHNQLMRNSAIMVERLGKGADWVLKKSYRKK